MRERLQIFVEELARRILRQGAFFIEQRRRAADVSLGLLQRRHVEEHERLSEVVIRAEGAQRAW